MKTVFNIFSNIIIAITLFSNIGFSQTKLSSSTFGSIQARQIGPAVMSGRITDIDAVNNDSRIIYVGTADGGIWKSVTGGTLFKPIFEKYPQSIGALKIDQKNPEVIWAGTGESNMRNSVSVGTGIYKSEDAGETWQKMGLENTEHISKIIIDPENSKTVYVAAPGPLWSDSKERGLYKTKDGGKTWKQILYVDDKTGCADIVVDPTNSQIIYASMWQFRRKPWSFSSGGPGSGLFKSVDGGQTWKRIDKGFSDGELGRICLAMSPSEPENIYAIAESKKTALFQTIDGGETWKQNSASGNVTARPFYFSVLQVDPTDPKRVYRPAFNLSISDDGGESFRSASNEGGWVHSDLHAIWINPKNPQQIYLGTDGGVYMSLDRGNNWLFLNNIPVSQFYKVNYDLEKPYNVYGGLQDNGSWYGPSNAPGGINARYWVPVGFGDGFSVVPDLTDKNIVYWESQGGELERYNKATYENKDIKPYPLKGEDKLRYNWNTPVYSNPLNPGTLYIGAQYLFRTTNKGETWERISPDLTTNDPEKQKQDESGGLSVDNSSAENHCTIYAINESPSDPNLIWVGTDDGNIQVTENGGKTWTNVVDNIPGLPKNTWCSSIDASPFAHNTAYATFDGHALGDKNVYVYKTNDLGKTWQPLMSGDIKGYAHKIKQDIVNPSLLFLGTEFGLFMSINDGADWAEYKSNVPEVAVRDIAIHPETNDVILATHGRGIIIIDDITPLRNLSNDVLDAEAYILPTKMNYVNPNQYDGLYPNEAGNYIGPNTNTEAIITYYLKDRAIIGDLHLEIYDQQGKLLKTLQGTKRKGINRISWDMRMKPPKVASAVRVSFGGFVGPVVPEGNYTVKLIKGAQTFTGNLELQSDPNSAHNKADRELRYKTIMQLYSLQEDLAYLTQNIMSIMKSSGKILEKKEVNEDIKNSLTQLTGKLGALRKTLVATKEGTGITGEEQLREKLADMYGTVMGYEGKPTDSQLERVVGLEYDFNNAKQTADEILSTLDAINAQLVGAGLNKIEIMPRETFDKSGKNNP